MSYIGIPPFGQTARTVTTFTATASQTTFTPTGGYIVGYIDVHYNGVKLVLGDDYTAANGTTVVLTAAANSGDVVETVAYMPVSLADTYRTSEADNRFVNAAGDTMTGTLLVTPQTRTMSDFPDGHIGFGDATHTSGWVVNQAVCARSGDTIWAFGSNGSTGSANATLFLGIGSIASSTFASALEVTQQQVIKLPHQPYAQASCGTVSTGKIPLNANNAYRGGMTIDNTNNRFNVPVSGAYVIGYHHLGNSGSGACQVSIRVNGADVPGSRTQDTNSSNDSFGTQVIRPLSAGDYIEFWAIQNYVHGNPEYNSMWAYLLG